MINSSFLRQDKICLKEILNYLVWDVSDFIKLKNLMNMLASEKNCNIGLGIFFKTMSHIWGIVEGQIIR